MDLPGSSSHKRHRAPTPLAGGIVIAVTLAVLGTIFNWFATLQLLGLAFGGMIIFLFGVLDDRFGFGVWTKLLGQGLAAVLVIQTGTVVAICGTGWINLVLTFLWIVGVVNAFNFVDSMDGLAVGLAGIMAAYFLLVTIEAGQPDLAIISAGITGTAFGLMYFNMNPARLFLGDSSSQLFGFLLAVIGLAYSPAEFPQINSWFIPIMVLEVPIFDTLLVVF
jgi:UDP-GlcNAc:undecaprenyl-phosphate/decaprenyl-phosphate GlcNAc-1-phosphate transferase